MSAAIRDLSALRCFVSTQCGLANYCMSPLRRRQSFNLCQPQKLLLSPPPLLAHKTLDRFFIEPSLVQNMRKKSILVHIISLYKIYEYQRGEYSITLRRGQAPPAATWSKDTVFKGSPICFPSLKSHILHSNWAWDS